MNSRAIELYKQACEFAYKVCKEEGRLGGPSDHIWNALSTGRFAELIVEECAQKVNHILRPGQGTYADEIREHFGVEE